MAEHYVSLIRSLAPELPKTSQGPGPHDGVVEVILGGWSLGGALSLEMARLLADDETVKVKGIVMIDSVYPRRSDGRSSSWTGKNVVPHVPTFRDNCAPETRVAVQHCMIQAMGMVERWTLPSWNSISTTASEPSSSSPNATDPSPPPTILLRSKESLPIPPSSPEGAISRVDIYRQDRLLGWQNYGPNPGFGDSYNLISAVTDVPGHHFNMFEESEHVGVVTQKLRAACELIDRGLSGGGKGVVEF